MIWIILILSLAGNGVLGMNLLLCRLDLDMEKRMRKELATRLLATQKQSLETEETLLNLVMKSSLRDFLMESKTVEIDRLKPKTIEEWIDFQDGVTRPQ